MRDGLGTEILFQRVQKRLGNGAAARLWLVTQDYWHVKAFHVVSTVPHVRSTVSSLVRRLPAVGSSSSKQRCKQQQVDVEAVSDAYSTAAGRPRCCSIS